MSLPERISADRRLRLIVVAGSITIIVVAVAMFVGGWLLRQDEVPIGLDWIGYRRGWERLVTTGTPYQAFQLAGPYTPEHLDFIHPPSFLPLVAPFTILPSPFDYIAWMAVPTALTILLLRRLAWWAWPVVAILAITPNTLITYINGNSSMWFAAAFGWSLYIGWSAGLIAMKPSLAILGLPGFVRDPRGTAILVAIPLMATLPFLATWADWVTILTNAEGLGPFYSLVQWTVFTIVALPWITTRGVDRYRSWQDGRRDGRRDRDGQAVATGNPDGVG
ncbi:MAG TPA: glycosyltransferase family 87 protein [Candidatus Limnocylindrales bacterium]|nr:glycosyltransferase family 87 protein [Candidatus Limnocylindrales bacterium]